MSCCGNTFHMTNTTMTDDARKRLTDGITDCGNAVYFTPAHNDDVITPVQGCAGARDCTPIPEVPLCPREYRLCRDQNGCATRFPADCRNLFWPNFSHPRWLPCNCLYCTRRCRVNRAAGGNCCRQSRHSCCCNTNCGCGC